MKATSTDLLPAAQAKAAEMMNDHLLELWCSKPDLLKKMLENAFMEGALWLRKFEDASCTTKS